MKNAEETLAEVFVGKTIKGFEYGSESEYRQAAIGHKINRVSIAFNDGREDAGLLLNIDTLGFPVFVYANESLDLE